MITHTFNLNGEYQAASKGDYLEFTVELSFEEETLDEKYFDELEFTWTAIQYRMWESKTLEPFEEADMSNFVATKNNNKNYGRVEFKYFEGLKQKRIKGQELLHIAGIHKFVENFLKPIHELSSTLTKKDESKLPKKAVNKI